MSNYDYWLERRNKIETSIGKWVGGDDVVIRNYSLKNDLLGNATYMQVIVLNATGKLVSKNLADWLEANFIGMSYPDARIWCNQVGALCGSEGSSVSAATVAGVLAADSRAYGGSKSSLIGVDFIRQALMKVQAGMTIDQLVSQSSYKNGKPNIMGFARPVARADERIDMYDKLRQQLGFKVGKHLKLAFEISAYLESNFNLSMNSGGYSCAFLADQDFSAQQVYNIKCMCVASGVTACFTDYSGRAQNSFLPLKCEDIDYNGPSPRPVE
ncbi:hypothetical protein DS2_04960 [Catenovulum agarivorans DS-2]|uniref:Uncharacterized protein n=1 Tax=Catenovulum agarivorans DS-2 TaxID=1328313 RepID=W7QE57_9ALTE|nr:hypothetical protein [Catenovulum agarivorans]EWH11179.1 hypothetical protein DS2_04960 [Catenovulum agarivorans DS-2]